VLALIGKQLAELVGYSRMGQLLNLAFWDVGIGLAGAPGLWRNDEVAFHGGDSGGGGGCGPGGAGLFE
jgi:hypothetical protein